MQIPAHASILIEVMDMIFVQFAVMGFLIYAGLAWIDRNGYQRGKELGYSLGYFDGKHRFSPSYPLGSEDDKA